MPANRRISASTPFPVFQEIHSGCCTVAALASPSGYAHCICTQLHIHAALLPVVIKDTREMMNLGLVLEGIVSRIVEPRRPPEPTWSFT